MPDRVRWLVRGLGSDFSPQSPHSPRFWTPKPTPGASLPSQPGRPAPQLSPDRQTWIVRDTPLRANWHLLNTYVTIESESDQSESESVSCRYLVLMTIPWRRSDGDWRLRERQMRVRFSQSPCVRGLRGVRKVFEHLLRCEQTVSGVSEASERCFEHLLRQVFKQYSKSV